MARKWPLFWVPFLDRYFFAVRTAICGGLNFGALRRWPSASGLYSFYCNGCQRLLITSHVQTSEQHQMFDIIVQLRLGYSVRRAPFGSDLCFGWTEAS